MTYRISIDPWVSADAHRSLRHGDNLDATIQFAKWMVEHMTEAATVSVVDDMGRIRWESNSDAGVLYHWGKATGRAQRLQRALNSTPNRITRTMKKGSIDPRGPAPKGLRYHYPPTFVATPEGEDNCCCRCCKPRSNCVKKVW